MLRIQNRDLHAQVIRHLSSFSLWRLPRLFALRYAIRITLPRVVHLPDATSVSTKVYLIVTTRIESLASIGLGGLVSAVTGDYIYHDE